MARGDHIYVERMGGLYSHHAIDCGDGTAIHYWTDDIPFGSSVRRTTLEEFAEGGPVGVRGYGECDPPERVIERAEASLGARGFDPLNSNCEHFAVWCKTGRRESRQVRRAAAYLRERPAAAAAALMFSPVLVPMAVVVTFVGNIVDGLAGELQDERWR